MKFIPHHIAFTVINMEKSISWYQDKLGFKVYNKYNKGGMEITLLELADTKIELFNFKDNTMSLPDYRRELMDDLHVQGTKHLCIEVDELDKTVEKLKLKGVEFIGKPDTTFFGGKSIFFKDCNGILLELYQK